MDFDGHASFTQRPLDLVRALKDLERGAQETREAARSYLQWFHKCIAQPKKKKGRPVNAILIAVTQQLRRVGAFKFSEIAQLIPDGIGGKPEEAVDRAKKRMKHKKDLRGIFTSTEANETQARSGRG